MMTGMGCQWPGMGLDMMKYDIFAESMKKSAAILKPLGIDLFDILKKDETHLLTHRKILPAFVTIAAIQVRKFAPHKHMQFTNSISKIFLRRNFHH